MPKELIPLILWVILFTFGIVLLGTPLIVFTIWYVKLWIGG